MFYILHHKSFLDIEYRMNRVQMISNQLPNEYYSLYNGKHVQLGCNRLSIEMAISIIASVPILMHNNKMHELPHKWSANQNHENISIWGKMLFVTTNTIATRRNTQKEKHESKRNSFNQSKNSILFG